MNFTERFEEVKAEKPFSFRGVARNIALAGLSSIWELKNTEALLKKPRIQFLYFHHIFNDEAEKFDLLLQELLKHHIFISHSEAVERILTNDIDKPYISLSSDDGFKNNTQAAKIMDRYNIPCCFFINPDFIGITDHKHLARICRSKWHFPPTEVLNWEDVESLMKNGHEIGSHTIDHINIAKTGVTAVEDNLTRAYDELRSRCGRIKHFAFPYGRFFHFNYDAFKLVFDVGYESCASAERGCHVTSHSIEKNDLLIRRDQIILDWNKKHIYYFLLKSSSNANQSNNYNPYRR